MRIFNGKALAEANSKINTLQGALTETVMEARALTRKVEMMEEKQEESASGLYGLRLQRDIGWTQLTGNALNKIQKSHLDSYAQTAEFFYLFNPLIKRAVDVRTLFTFSRGYDLSVDEASIKIKEKYIDPVIEDPYNEGAFTSQQAIEENDRILQETGNLFIAVFAGTTPGIRTIRMEEITDIIRDENDSGRVLFYKRQFVTGTKSKVVYYPDINNADRKTGANLIGVDWNVHILHVYTNKIRGLGFGMTDLAAACRWADAQGKFLEDWGAVVRAIRKYSSVVQTSGGQSTVNAITAQFAGSTANMNTPLQSNPAGSSLVMGQGNDLKVVDAGSGKIVGPKDSRLFTLQVCAATGVPETILTGDPSTGNLATAKELTGPFLTMIESRQELWASVIKRLVQFILRSAGQKGVMVKVSFPPLSDYDVNDRIQALVSAATMDSKMWANTMSPADFVRAIYETLDIEISEDELSAIVDDAEMNTATTEALKEVQKNLARLVDDGK